MKIKVKFCEPLNNQAKGLLAQKAVCTFLGHFLMNIYAQILQILFSYFTIYCRKTVMAILHQFWTVIVRPLSKKCIMKVTLHGNGLKSLESNNVAFLMLHLSLCTENRSWSLFHQCIPVGCVPPACWPHPSMHCGWGGCTCQGYLPSGVPAQIIPPHPPWTEWLTDRCKNITFGNFLCGR